MSALNYHQAIYASYRSAFKGRASSASLAFGAAKLRPVIQPWVKHLPTDARIVDLGCGAGELLLAFQQLGFTNLAGCDLSEEQIIVAKSITPEVTVANLFEYLNGTDGHSLDVITLFDVIEHLTRQNTFELLRLIHSKLRSGGLLIGHVPNGLSPFVGHVFYGDPTHEWCPTPSSLRTLLNICCFENFAAVEHLGAGANVRGRIRRQAWSVLRSLLSLANAIETGSYGESIWTRNFAFKATA